MEKDIVSIDKFQFDSEAIIRGIKILSGTVVWARYIWYSSL
jgi:hypothetical protein